MAKKILLADDSITIQKVVELTFAEGDYEVICASDGAQAIRKIEESVPDVALVDVMMPQRNGYDVCAHVKQDPDLAWIPVLLLTGTFEPFDPRRSDEVGANGHIIKPFESRSLVAQVEELIEKHPRPASAQDEPAEPIEPSKAPDQVEVVNAGQIFEAGEGGQDSPPVPAPPGGAATVRLDSRDFFSQLQQGGAEILETPQSAPSPEPPSLGPLDLAASESETEPTRPVRAAEPSPAPSEEPAPAVTVPREEVEKLTAEKIETLVRPIIQETVERVIQEVAWEVIPEVAESLVRRRIKELEEEAGGEGQAPLN